MTVTVDPIRLSMQASRDNDGRTAYDLLFVGTTKNPGIAKITAGADRPYRIDVQQVPGQQGNIIWYRGWDKVEGIGVQFKFWEVGQIDEFYQSYLPLFTKSGSPQGVTVANPVLYANDITKLLLKKAGQLKGDVENGWTVDLEFVEYRKAKRITAEKAEPATSDIPSKPNSNSKLIAQRDKLLAMANKPT